MKKVEQDICPKCGSYNTEVYDSDMDFPIIKFNCVCKDCKTYFNDVFSMNYIGFDFEDEEYDEQGNLIK